MANPTRKVHSIAKQMFKVVFAIYFLVTLITTTVYILTDYQTNEEEVLNDLMWMYRSSEPELAQALWELDAPKLRQLSEDLVAHPSVLGIKMVAPNGQLLGGAGTVVNDKGQSVSINEQNQEVFEHKVMGMFAQVHEIAYSQSENLAVDLGTVTVYSNSRIVLLRIKRGVWMILISGVIKALALWLIFWLVSRIWLKRPFFLLTEAVKNLDVAQPKKLEIELPSRRRNEVSVLTEAFNQKVVALVNAHAWWTPAEKKVIPATEVVQSSVDSVQPQYETQVRFVCEFQDNPPLECWPLPLSRAFVNLLLNACQAIEMKKQKENSEVLGQITITTTLEAQTLKIRFEDNGSGMPPEDEKRMFDPFYTTKEAGAGLGMSVALEIIEKHCGRITVQSQPDVGTRVTVTLPL